MTEPERESAGRAGMRQPGAAGHETAGQGAAGHETAGHGVVRREAGRPEAVRVAAIDCGTNSLRLLIADIDVSRAELADVDRRMEIVRLGQGVDATGRLAPEALARTFGVVGDYAEAIGRSGASMVRMVATSAIRDASNAAEFVRGVIDILGVAPEVVSGDQEAFLSFTGATAELGRPGQVRGDEAGPGDRLGDDGLGRDDGRPRDSDRPGGGGRPRGRGRPERGDGLRPPYLVVDIGGGSTEFVLGVGDQTGSEPAGSGPAKATESGAAGRESVRATDSGAAGSEPAKATDSGAAGSGPAGSGPAGGPPARSGYARGALAGSGSGPGPVGGRLAAVSMNIGCVRLTERHLHTDPPGAAEIQAATADIDAALSEVAAKIPVASAGTLVGLAGSVTTVTAIALGLPAYDPARTHHARIPAGRVHEVTLSLLGMTRAQRSAIGALHPGRVDVIGAGALILDRIMSRFGFAEMVASEHDILDGIAWSIVAGTR
jgi:exopolyphosphatase/guanosine-5'-triphosphate,3'-diphosphate pyrophosphatase